MHSEFKLAQLRLDRAIMNFQHLNENDSSTESLAIALSRLVTFTNTIASNIHQMSRDPASKSFDGCADLLWRFGEELRTINPDWFGYDEAR